MSCEKCANYKPVEEKPDAVVESFNIYQRELAKHGDGDWCKCFRKALEHYDILKESRGVEGWINERALSALEDKSCAGTFLTIGEDALNKTRVIIKRATP